MKIIALIAAAFVHFTTFLQTLVGFYLISKTAHHPWLHDKFIYIENKYSDLQIRVANTTVKSAQFFLAKIAFFISIFSLVGFWLFSKFELQTPLLMVIYTMVFSFYFAMSVYLGYRPIKLFKSFSKPYLQLTLMSLACGALELLGLYDFMGSAADHIFLILDYPVLTQYFNSLIAKILLFSLFPMILYVLSFVIIYTTTIPGFVISTIFVGTLLFITRLLNAVAPEHKLSFTCALGYFINENFKKWYE